MASVKPKNLAEGTKLCFQVTRGGGVELVEMAAAAANLQLVTVTEPSPDIPVLTGSESQVNIIYPLGVASDLHVTVTLAPEVSRATIVPVNLSTYAQTIKIRSRTYIAGATLIDDWWVWDNSSSYQRSQPQTVDSYLVTMTPEIGRVVTGNSATSTMMPPAPPTVWELHGFTPDGDGVYHMTIAELRAVQLYVSVSPTDYLNRINAFLETIISGVTKDGAPIILGTSSIRNTGTSAVAPNNLVIGITNAAPLGNDSITPGSLYVYTGQFTLNHQGGTSAPAAFVLKVFLTG